MIIYIIMDVKYIRNDGIIPVGYTHRLPNKIQKSYIICSINWMYHIFNKTHKNVTEATHLSKLKNTRYSSKKHDVFVNNK